MLLLLLLLLLLLNSPFCCEGFVNEDAHTCLSLSNDIGPFAKPDTLLHGAVSGCKLPFITNVRARLPLLRLTRETLGLVLEHGLLGELVITVLLLLLILLLLQLFVGESGTISNAEE